MRRACPSSNLDCALSHLSNWAGGKPGYPALMAKRRCGLRVMGLRVLGLRAIGLGVLAMLAASCAADTAPVASAAAPPEQENAPVSAPVSAPPTMPLAAMVAQRLAQAEAAFEDGDSEKLARVLASLDASGAKPHQAAPAQMRDVLAKWQQASRQHGESSAPPFRGRLLGPAFVRGELGPGEVWRSSQTFKSGETSTLSVSHRGDGPVRMAVSDGRARPICSPDTGAAAACRFTPRYTQRYNIELRNEGGARAVYFLVFD